MSGKNNRELVEATGRVVEKTKDLGVAVVQDAETLATAGGIVKGAGKELLSKGQKKLLRESKPKVPRKATLDTARRVSRDQGSVGVVFQSPAQGRDQVRQ